MFGNIAIAFLRGVVDSLRGFVAIFYLDRLPPQQPQEIGTSSTGPPLTVLAKRRLEEKAKQASTSSEKKTAKTGSKSGTEEKPKAWRRLFSCVILNLLCIVVLHYLIAPLIEASVVFIFGDRRVAGVASVLSSLWILPVFAITRLVNALWFQDIANAAQRYRLSGTGQQQPQQIQSFSRNVADFLIAILLETIFLLQSYTVGLLPLPIVNFLFSYIHVCLLYSLYAFEYVWMSEGVELRKRIQRIECNWPYFFGFGCLLAAVTLYPSSVVLSGCLFGVFFPVLIISSFQANSPSVVDGSEWQRINFFDPSLYLCEKISLHLIHRATARTLKHRR